MCRYLRSCSVVWVLVAFWLFSVLFLELSFSSFGFTSYFEIIVFTWVNCFHLLTLRCVLSSVCINLSAVCSASPFVLLFTPRAVLTFLVSELDSGSCWTVFTVQFQPERGVTFCTSALYVTPKTSTPASAECAHSSWFSYKLMHFEQFKVCWLIS